MTDREAFEAWLTPRRGKICPPHPEDYWEVWQAALASERAKRAEPWGEVIESSGTLVASSAKYGAKPLPVGTLIYAAPTAVQAEPSKDQYEQECSDIDAILAHLGLDIEQCRTDGGWLNVPKIKTLLQQAQESYERAKQSATTNVGIDWANPATLNGVLCHAVQQQAEPVEAGPWIAYASEDGKKAWVDSLDFTHDVRLNISGDFEDDKQKFAYAEALARKLNAAPPAAQSEPVALDRWGIKSVPGRPEDYWFEKMPDGYWTPWHLANEALQLAAPPAAQGPWEETARQYAENARFWREKYEATQQQAEPAAEGDTIDRALALYNDAYCECRKTGAGGGLSERIAMRRVLEFLRAAPPADQEKRDRVK